MYESQIDDAVVEEMKEQQEEEIQEQQEDQMLNSQEFQETYGVPHQEQTFNQHSFLANSLSFDQPEKVTFLSSSELGVPLFNMRFLLDIEDVAKYHLDEIFKKYGIENKIANYFREKINNIADSGMSNQGFIQNLNVTRKGEMVRKRIKNIPTQKNRKGGLNIHGQ